MVTNCFSTRAVLRPRRRSRATIRKSAAVTTPPSCSEASWRAAAFRRLGRRCSSKRSPRRRYSRATSAAIWRGPHGTARTLINAPDFPLLAETFGDDTAKKVADWLDYKGGDEGGGTGPGENAADRAPLLIWYGEDPPPPPKYLVSNMLPEDGVALIGGQFLLGKTFVGADLSAAVMTAGVFAGEPVMRKGAILWFAAEGEKEIEGRVRAAVENKFGGSGPQPFARQAGGVPLLTDPDALEKLKAHAQEAAKYAREKFGLPLALIVIDTVSAAAGFTDENSASETQKVMTTLRELSRATGALVLPIDHYGKQTETGIRGSSAKSAAADAILACLGERDNEGNVSNHRLAVTKLRNGPTGRVIPFELRQTETAVRLTCIVEWRLTAVEAAPVEKPKGLAKVAPHLQARAPERSHRFRSENAAVRGQPRGARRRPRESSRRVHAGLSGRQPKGEGRGFQALRKGCSRAWFYRFPLNRRGSGDDRFVAGPRRSMNTAATAIIGHTYGHTGHIPTVFVAVVVAICATPATFVVVVAGVATALVWDLRSSILSSRVFAASPVDAVSLAAKGLSAPNPTKEDGSLPLRLSQTNTIASFASAA